MNKTFIIAEVGINANGSLELAKQLIDVAVESGCDAVKFQKRTIDKVYTAEELDKPRESPFGTTNREQKMGLEFGKEEYDEIDRYCKEKGIEWFASPWDLESAEFLKQYDCKYNKIASALLTDEALLVNIAKQKKMTFISTGMSTMEEIMDAIVIFELYGCPYQLMHTNSVYPMPTEDANLRVIKTLEGAFGNNEFCRGIGYSNHSSGIIITCASVALGATCLEFHITLDRTMYGSDQSASIEPTGVRKIVEYAREIEKAMGDSKKKVTKKEEQVKAKLRKV